MTRKALVFGSNGQDGSYLAPILLKEGWEVYGVVRRTSTDNLWRLREADVLDHKNFYLLEGDITDMSSILLCMQTSQASHIYNLSAQSHVGTSFRQPRLTTDVTYGGVVNLLEACRIWEVDSGKKLRIYQASSSEMFGENFSEKETKFEQVGVHTKIGAPIYKDRDGNLTYQGHLDIEKYQDESTAFFPCSPYGVAKLAAHNLCNVYRKSYSMDIRCGILFNHESERRGEGFVTKKVTRYIGDLVRHMTKDKDSVQRSFSIGSVDVYENCTIPAKDNFPKLKLGNLGPCRDWGHAEDYVDAIYKIMNTPTSTKDLVIGTGETYTIQQFVEAAFARVDLNWKDHVEYNTKENMRPCEVLYLKADASLARKELNWEPKVNFNQLVSRMVDYDVKQRSISRNL